MSLEPQSQAVINALNGSGSAAVQPVRADRSAAETALVARSAPAGSDALRWQARKKRSPHPTERFAYACCGRARVRAGEAMPAVIYFHGGGFFAGGIDETDELARTIAKRTDSIVVNVDYHLAPEARFPVAVNDAYAALCWVASHPDIDPNRIVLAGESAGGNLTIVTCLMARERGGPRIRFQVPIYPSLDLRRAAAVRIAIEMGRRRIRSEQRRHRVDARPLSRQTATKATTGAPHRSSRSLMRVCPPHSSSRRTTIRWSTKASCTRIDCRPTVSMRSTRASPERFTASSDTRSLLDVGSRALNLICDRIKQAVSTLSR